MGDAGLVVGLKGARVGPLVGYLHLVDVDGEVAVVAVGQRDALVQRPLVRPREQDVGAVEPGLVGHLLVNPTSAWGQEVMHRFHARLVFLHQRDMQYIAECCLFIAAHRPMDGGNEKNER